MRQSKYSQNFCMNLSIKTPATIIIYLSQRTSQNYFAISRPINYGWVGQVGVGGDAYHELINITKND